MKGHSWKSKLIMLLIVYFAGFATAIYCMMPTPDAKALKAAEKKGFAHSALKSDEFAKSFNVNMHKFMNYSKDAAKRFSAYLKDKRKEKREEKRQTAKADK
ncbi:MAG: hypothetical protein JW947_08295 [Sedimentisphaerales bacterium]|nr:hypothetical protein [Sedimentisphaerales bacterium]